MRSILWYLLATLGEIGGCFAFWAWLRMNKSPLWVFPGAASLVFFALALTRIDADAAGRPMAYGGVYILSALVWLWLARGSARPLGCARGCDVPRGAAIILYGPRGH